MSVLALPGARWTQKPLPGTDLDRTHAYCPDHCWPFLSPQGTAQSLVKAARLAQPSTTGDIYTGSSSMVPGRKYGLSVRHGSITDVTRLTGSADLDKVVPLSGGWTLLIASRKTDTTNRASFAFGPSMATGGIEVQGLIPYSDGTVYFDFGGSVAGTSRVSVAGLTFGDDLWGFSTGPRGMEIWQNGLLRASNSGNASRSASSNAFYLTAFNAGQGDLADYALVMTWRRQLPAAAIRALSVNPWQVFQPRTVLVVTAAAAAPVPKLNTLLLAP